MLDTTQVTTAIAAMIRTGTTEQALLAAVARQFPGPVAGSQRQSGRSFNRTRPTRPARAVGAPSSRDQRGST